ncbi:hypothetical protein P4O66_001700 [Electrophorus voltai]|uniref:Uncharacterized protein n=1 Tax=Electrophorus voltai TaxID=2609070 RepID=A0AAD8Z7T9_9TELE|nr:hypothetical protein P4O66_001700 [Electrophorus voltai]
MEVEEYPHKDLPSHGDTKSSDSKEHPAPKALPRARHPGQFLTKGSLLTGNYLDPSQHRINTGIVVCFEVVKVPQQSYGQNSVSIKSWRAIEHSRSYVRLLKVMYLIGCSSKPQPNHSH